MVTAADETVFSHPVGLLLFNRPEYAAKVLASLRAQTRPIEQRRLVIMRDGYIGSRDAFDDLPDRTNEVDALVAEYFPDATFIRSERNVGIARAFEELYQRCFSGDAAWAVLCEEDFVLDPDYLEVMGHLISAAHEHSRIVTVSATGDVGVPRDRGMDSYYPDRHLWAYALRRSFWELTQPYMSAYMSALGRTAYWQRDEGTVDVAMTGMGLVLPGTSQDYVKRGVMRLHGLLSINTGHAHGEHIGKTGLHFTEDIFESLGYSAPRPPGQTGEVLPPITSKILDELEDASQRLWASEHLALRQLNRDDLRRLRTVVAENRDELREVRAVLRRSSAVAEAADDEQSTPRGGWTWFGGTSALSIGNVHLLGLVRRRPGIIRGESCLAVLDERGGEIRTIALLKGLKLDDHNVPTIVPISNESFIVAATGHGDTSLARIALGVVKDGDVRVGRRVDIDFGEPTTYVHVVPEGPESFLLITRTTSRNFCARRIDMDTLESISDDMDVFPRHLAQDDELWSGRDGNRPYLITRRAEDGVLFALTHDHPRAYRNGVVAGRFRGPRVYDLDDNLVATVDVGAPAWDPFADLTEIIPPGEQSIPWVHDIAEERLDVRPSAVESGAVHIAVSRAVMTEVAFRRGADRVHDNLTYNVFRRERHHPPTLVFEGNAGPSLYSEEEHYAGGIALNPRNPYDILFSSSRIPPKAPISPSTESESVDGEQPMWSLLMSEKSGDRRQTRVLQAGHENASFIRPLFSDATSDAGGHAAFAMRGRYTSYRDFETHVWSSIFTPTESCWAFPNAHYDLPYPLTIGAGMPARETAYLRRLLRGAGSFLEYGGGSSTLLAFEKGVRSVMTVETDVRLAAILEQLARSSSSSFRCVGPTISTTFEWGQPAADADIEALGIAYANAPFDADEFAPDVVLIDGRYRVACAFAVAARVTKRTIILIDDYVGREGYRVIEEYLGRPKFKGRLAVFVVQRSIEIPPEVMSAACGMVL